MRKSDLISKGLFFLILLFQIFNVQAQEFGFSPFHKCWQIENNREESAPVFTASDNVNGFYTAFSDGSIEFINKNQGQIYWRSDVGGKILPVINLDAEKLYILSEDLPAKLNNGPEDSNSKKSETESEISIIALSKETGVTKWHNTAKLSTLDSEKVYLLGSDSKLFLITNSGKIFFFDKETGKIELQYELHTKPASIPSLVKQYIFIGTSDKKVLGISIKTGKQEIQYESRNLPLEIFGDAETELFIADELGNVTAVDLKSGESRWQFQSGAQIANITLIERGLLITSLDNYVYLVSKKNGNRIWRKRLSGRSIGQPFIKNKIAVFSTLNGNDTVFIELNKGKAVNRILIPEENYFLNNPVGLENLLLFQTYQGLIAYGTESDCGKK